MFFRDLKVFIGASAIAMIIWPGFQVVLPAGAVEKQMASQLQADALDTPRPEVKAQWEQDIEAPNPSAQTHDEPVHPITTPRVSNYMQRLTLTPVQKPVAGAPVEPPVQPSPTIRQAKIEIHSPAEAQPAAVTVQVPRRPGVVSSSPEKPKNQAVQLVKSQVVDDLKQAQRQAEVLKAAKLKSDEQIAQQKHREQQAALAQQQKLTQQAKQQALAKEAQVRQHQQDALAKAAKETQAQERALQKKQAVALAQEKAFLKQKELEKHVKEIEQQRKQALALAQEQAVLKQKERAKQAQARERLTLQSALARQESLERKRQQEALEKASHEKEIQQKTLLRQQALEQRAQAKEQQRKQALALAQEQAMLKQRVLDKRAQEKELEKKQALVLAEQKAQIKQKYLQKRAQEKEQQRKQTLALLQEKVLLKQKQLEAQAQQKAQLKLQRLAQAQEKALLKQKASEKRAQEKALLEKQSLALAEEKAILKQRELEKQAQEKALEQKQALAVAQEKALLKQKALEKRAQEKELFKKQALVLAEQKALLKQRALATQAQERALFLQRAHVQTEREALLKQQALAQRAQEKALRQQAALEREHQHAAQRQEALAHKVQQQEEQKSLALNQQQLAQKQAQEQEHHAQPLAHQQAIQLKDQADRKHSDNQAMIVQLPKPRYVQLMVPPLQPTKPQAQPLAEAVDSVKLSGVYMARSSALVPEQSKHQVIALMQPNTVPQITITISPKPLRPANALPLKVQGLFPPTEATQHPIKGAASCLISVASPAVSSGNAQQQAARYAELLAKWLAPQPKQSLEPVLMQGQAAAKAILREAGTLSPEALQSLGQQMQGYILRMQGEMIVAPDPAYFAEQAMLHGLPADRAFTALMRQTLNGYWPVTRQQISGMNGCTRFGSHELVRLYGAWKEFQNTYPHAYVQLLTDPNLPLLSDIEDQLLNSHSACDGPDSVQDEWQAFMAGYPDSDLTPKLKKRLGHYRRKSAGMVFYEGVQYAVDPNLIPHRGGHE